MAPKEAKIGTTSIYGGINLSAPGQDEAQVLAVVAQPMYVAQGIPQAEGESGELVA